MSYLMNTIQTVDIEFVRTEGNYLITTGRKYPRMILDWFMDNGTTPWGYGAPRRIHEGISVHVPNAIVVDKKERVSEKLCKKTFMDKLFYSMSGSEAIECAIKIARKYNYDKKYHSSHTIWCYEGGFHGRTFGALSASDSAKYHKEGFGPLLSGFNYFKNYDEIYWERAGAVLFETIFGNNDVRPHSIDFYMSIREKTLDYEIPLIFDEIQCGHCRTGAFNAYYPAFIPDILCLGKGIAAGIPMGVTLARGEFAKVLTPGTHFSTFGGNPYSIEGLDFTLRESDQAISNGRKIGEKIYQELHFLKGVGDVRRVGTMIAIDCLDGRAQEVSKRMLDLGLFVPTFRDKTIKLSPSFSTTNEELEFGLNVIKKSFGGVYS